jgi:tol-pal system protein YbgF
MRARSAVLAVAGVFVGVVIGSLLSPRPTGAVSKEIIQLQEDVSQLLQGQQAMRSTIDSNNASMRTLLQQSLDSVNGLNQQMGTLQKNVQEATANSASKIDTMSTQTQGLSDNLQDVQARVAKVAAQLNDMQSTLQSIDGRIAGGAPVGGAPGPGASGAGAPAAAGGSEPASSGGGGVSAQPGISSDTLYQNALRDFTTGKYDLARQEFGDYVLHFPSTDLASNAQFYLGEISYAQADFKDAIAQYNLVLANYPQSYKLAAALLKKGFAELELGMKATGTKDLREVAHRFPGSDEARRAQAKLREIGASATPGRSSSQR